MNAITAGSPCLDMPRAGHVRRVIALLLTAVVAWPLNAAALAAFGTTASISLTGGTIDFPPINTQPSNVTTLFKGQIIDNALQRQAAVSGDESALGQIAAARTTGAAASTIGTLRAVVTGAAEARSTSAPNAPFKLSTASIDSRLSAGWYDTATILDVPAGRLVAINAVIDYAGTLLESLNTSAGVDLASVGASVRLSGTGIRVATNGNVFEKVLPATRTAVNPPSLVPVSMVVQTGQAFTLQYTLSVRGTADLASGLFGSNSPAFRALQEATFSADYSHTARWGGITNITDVSTGEILNGWSISAQSGFDYARPAPVPLPAPCLLLATGLLTLRLRLRSTAERDIHSAG